MPTDVPTWEEVYGARSPDGVATSMQHYDDAIFTEAPMMGGHQLRGILVVPENSRPFLM